MSALAELDSKRYARLVASARPVVIRNEDENERLLARVEKLMAKGEANLSPEESALLELLVRLVDDYESQERLPAEAAGPAAMLRWLMQENGMTAKELAEVIGSRSRVSEILSGKRSISKEQARRLAEHFRVSMSLFL